MTLMVAPAGGFDPGRPALRIVPGRVALFLTIILLVSVLMGPRLAAVSSTAPPVGIHVVESGQTLWGVAGEYASDGDPRNYVDRLLALNELSSPHIQPGQRLILP